MSKILASSSDEESGGEDFSAKEKPSDVKVTGRRAMRDRKQPVKYQESDDDEEESIVISDDSDF